MVKLKNTFQLMSFIFFHQALASSEPIKIGAIFPASGPMGDAMCVSKASAAFIRENWNLPIDILELENMNNEEGTIKAAKKAVELKPIAVIGTRTSQEAIIASDILNAEKIPFLAFMASHPDVVKNKKYALHLLANSNSYAEQIAEDIVKVLNKDVPLAIVRNVSAPYSDFYGKRVEELVRKRRPLQKIENFEIINGYKNYTALREKIDKVKAKIIYAPLYTIEFTSLMGELVSSNREGIVYSNGGFTDAIEFIKQLSMRAPRLIVKYNGVWNEKPAGKYAKIYKNILKTSCSKYESNLRTALAFDSVFAIAVNLKKDQSLRENLLIGAIRKNTYEGVSGELNYNQKEFEPNRAIVFHYITNGKFHVIEK